MRTRTKKHVANLLSMMIVLSSTYLLIFGMLTQGRTDKTVIFRVLAQGTADEFGNRIQEIKIEQDKDQGNNIFWVTRGTANFSNFASGTNIVGIFNQSIRFTCIVRLNFSFATSPSDTAIKTDVFLTVSGEFTNQAMEFDSVALDNETEGWKVTYIFIWDEDLKPDTSSMDVLFRYFATGPGDLTGLNLYESTWEESNDPNTTNDLIWGDDMSTLSTWVEQSFLTKSQPTVNSSDGDLIHYEGYSSNFGGIQNQSLSIDVDTYPFFETRIRANHAAHQLFLRLFDGGFIDQGMTGTLQGSFVTWRVNLVDLAGAGSTITQISIHDHNDGFQNFSIDWARVYNITDWTDTSTSEPFQYAHKTRFGVNVTAVSADLVWAIRRTENVTVTATSTLVAEFRGSSTAISYFLFAFNGTDGFTAPTANSLTFTEVSFNLVTDMGMNVGDNITSLDIGTVHAGVDGWIEYKWVYIKDHGQGIFNQTLDETGGGGSEFDDIPQIVTPGFHSFLQEVGPTADWFETASDFRPLHNLGAFTICFWFLPFEVQAPIPDSDFYLASQKVGTDQEVSILYNENFTVVGIVGNGTDTVMVNHTTVLEKFAGATTDLKYFIALTWEKGGPLTVVVDDIVVNSSDTLFGTVDADANFQIGTQNSDDDLAISGVMWDLQLYFEVTTSAERDILRDFVGKAKPGDNLYHHYNFDEFLLGFAVGDPFLRDGTNVYGLREVWDFDFISQTVASFLFPFWGDEPQLYLFLIGVFLIIASPTLAMVLSKDKDFNTVMSLLLLGFAFSVIGFALFITGGF